jgi:hypothetical protein
MKFISRTLFVLALFSVFTLSTAVVRADVTNGLVARYLFDGNGSNAYGSGGSATVAGNFSYLSGGGVRIFGDGSERTSGGGYIQLPATSFGLSDSFTFNLAVSGLYQTFWANEPLLAWGVENNGNRIAGIGVPSGEGNVTGPSTSVSFDVFTYGQPSTGVSTANLSTNYFNQTRYITAVKSATNIALYLDGLLVGTATDDAGLPPDSVINIGRHSWVPSGGGTSTRLDASVYTVEIYNRALSSTEVAQVVPEPSTYALLLLSGAGALLWAKRRRS